MYNYRPDCSAWADGRITAGVGVRCFLSTEHRQPQDGGQAEKVRIIGNTRKSAMKRETMSPPSKTATTAKVVYPMCVLLAGDDLNTYHAQT